MADKKWMDILKLSVVVTALQMIFSQYVYPTLFGAPVRETFALVNLQTQTAINSPTAGNYLVGLLSGFYNASSVANFSLLGVTVGMFFGTFLLLTIGYWVADQKWAWQGRDKYQRLWAILLYGTVALGLLLYLLGAIAQPALSTMLFVGLIVNYAMLAIGVHLLAKLGIPVTV